MLVDHPQVLHCIISHSQFASPFFANFVYAKCSKLERLDLWNKLRMVASVSQPWMVGGDFNTISISSERKGGASPDLNSMNDLNNCINDCGLIDIGFSGPNFTWYGPNVAQRLDRILLNSSWLDLFKQNCVSHQLKRCSDHRTIILTSFIEEIKPIIISVSAYVDRKTRFFRCSGKKLESTNLSTGRIKMIG